MTGEIIFYDTWQSPVGMLHIYRDAKDKLLALDTIQKEEMEKLYVVKGGSCPALREQLAEYFAGQRRNFDTEVRLEGSHFQKAVWLALTRIPYGSTAAYEEIAAAIGNPAAARAVGNAVGENPVLICIPCHRIIRADGNLGGYRGGTERKEFLLRLEGALPA